MLDNGKPAEPLSNLLARYGAINEISGILDVSLSLVLSDGADPAGIISYLADLGIIVRRLDDLMLINGEADEEELSAHQVTEGVAIAVASQGDWLLFRP